MQLEFTRDTGPYKSGKSYDLAGVNPKIVARFLESGRAVKPGTQPAKQPASKGSTKK